MLANSGSKLSVLAGACVWATMLLSGCADAQRACSSDADCSAGESCVASGGVLFGERTCVREEPEAPVSDAGADDVGGGDDASGPSPVDTGADGFDDVSAATDAGTRPDTGGRPDAGDAGCVGETASELCTASGAVCGTLTVVDSCDQTRTVECGACAGPGVCGHSEPNQCGCSIESYCATLNAQCGEVDPQFCSNLDGRSCGGCAGGTCMTGVDGSAVCQCPGGYEYDAGSKNCMDVDECVRGLDTCDPTSEVCSNVAGTFECLCAQGYVATTQGCVVPPTLAGSWSGQARSNNEVRIPSVTAFSDAVYIAVITADNEGVFDVTGLGVNWNQLASQCMELGWATSFVWVTTAPPSNDGTVTARLDAQDLAVMTVTAWRNATIGPMIVRHNSLGESGGCVTDGTSSSLSHDLPTSSEASVVLMGAGARVGGASPQPTWLSPGTELVSVWEYGQNLPLPIVYSGQVGWQAPVTTPTQTVGGSFGTDRWATFLIELQPSP